MAVDDLALTSWQMLRDRIASETHAVRRQNLQIVEKHIVSEVDGDLDTLMETMVAEPVFHFWGATESRTLRGRSAVRSHYEEGVRMGKVRMAFDVGKIVVDDGVVVTEGVFTNAAQSGELPGRTFHGHELVPGSWYLVHRQALVVWPIHSSGLIVGEDIYVGEQHVIDRVLAPGEMPHLGPVSRSV